MTSDLKIIIYDAPQAQTLKALKLLVSIIDNNDGETSGQIIDEDKIELGEWEYTLTY